MPSLNPSGRVALKLLKIRDTLQARYERYVSWNEVLQHIFDELAKTGELKARIKALEEKYEGVQEKRIGFAEDIALELARKPQTMPMMMPMMQQTMMNGPPSAPPLMPPPGIPKISEGAPAFIKELQSFCKEDQIFLKPSEIRAAYGDTQNGTEIFSLETPEPIGSGETDKEIGNNHRSESGSDPSSADAQSDGSMD